MRYSLVAVNSFIAFVLFVLALVGFAYGLVPGALAVLIGYVFVALFAYRTGEVVAGVRLVQELQARALYRQEAVNRMVQDAIEQARQGDRSIRVVPNPFRPDEEKEEQYH